MPVVRNERRVEAVVGGWLLVVSLIAGPLGAHAQEDPSDEPGRPAAPTLRVAPVSADVVIDGRLTDTAWSAATDSIANLVTIEPEQGGVPAGRTIVKVLADPEAIVFGVRCYDPSPAGIVAFSKARDAVLDEEDHVLIVLDTFLDERSGYVFAVNPAGARFDGLVAERGEDVNSDWDAIWEAKATRDGEGWSAEIRIPVASLTFEQGLTRWGFNVQRRVQRLQETSRWSGADPDYEVYQTSRAGLLTDLPAFDLGVGLSVRPSFVGWVSKPGPGKGWAKDGQFSLDVTQDLGANMRFAATLNTDFSETEVDVRQVNLTRFPISFPEKRTFFLQGADIFEFGLGLDEESMIPVFTRRIGLVGPEEDEQTPIPIDVGGKVTGRVGEARVGALVVNTRKSNQVPFGEFVTTDVPDATMGMVRIKQDILEESAVGVLGTFGDQLGRHDSWTAGLDFTYQTSSFREDYNLLAGIWGLRNDRQGLRGDKSAYGVALDYPNDLWDVSVAGMQIGNAFDPSLGFVPRRDVRLLTTSVQFAPRPGRFGVRQMFHDVSLTQFTNLTRDRWETYSVGVKPVDWLFESGERVEVSVTWEGDRPPLEFEVAPDVDIAPGRYEWSRQFVALRSAAKRWVSGELSMETGGYYTGRLETLGARLTLRPSSLFAFELTGERNTGDVMAPENESIELFNKAFRQDLIGCRFEVNVSPDLQFSSLTQYDSESRELGFNSRLRWTFAPQGELFVVYNHDEIRAFNNHWQFRSSKAPLKLQYTWRF